MAKKPNLSEQLGQRRQQPPAEPVKPENPIAALSAQQQEEVHAGEHTDEDAGMHARIPAETQAGTRVRKRTTRGQAKKTKTDQQGEINVEPFYEQLRDKKHLANLSFRYQSDELKEFEAIYGELEQLKPGRMSKNDMARLAMILLCDDYRRCGDASTLVQVLKRM